MDVSIIIVNYNTKDLTMQCIDSVIEKTTDVKYEIILVDNASVDGSKELFENDDRITYYYNNENSGFGKANNIGFEIAKGKYLFLLNSDTLLLNNAVKMFFDYAESNQYNGALGSYLLDQEENIIHSYGEFITAGGILKKSLPRIGKKFKYNEVVCSGDYIDVDYITGADLFLPKSAIDRVGGFDPIFFMYCEEVDLQYRMKKEGYSRRVIKGPRIIHLEGASATTKKKKKKAGNASPLFDSRFKYLKKHNPYCKYVLFLIAFSFIKLLYIFTIDRLTLKQRIKAFFSNIK